MHTTESELQGISRREFLAGAGAVVLSAALPSSLAAAATAAGRSEGPPDLIVLNGKIITVDRADSIVQAVAVRGGLIQSVGPDRSIRPLAGEKTRLIDLKGKAVTPGLIDAHNHFQVVPLFNGYFTAFVPPKVKTLAELQEGLAELVARTTKGEWVKAVYLTVGQGVIPKRTDLDPISPNHPVWLMQQGGHYGTANTAALRVAGITRSTQDPVGGIIERDSRGEPTGVFYNHRAMDLLRRHIPAWDAETVRKNIVATQPQFAANGVTSYQDNNVRGLDAIGAYLDLGRDKKLQLRGDVYYTLEWPNDLDRALKQMARYEDPYMRFAGYKFLIDGQAPTAFCHEPHGGARWNMSTWEAASFKKAVRALHETGLQICVHCIGDAAVDLTLDAYEEAMNASPRPDPRHRIEHCILSTRSATKRIKDLGVVVSTQPTFIRIAADYWPTIFGQQRCQRIMVTREWLDAGIPLALGSDAPTTPWYYPQATLASAVARLSPTNKVFGPDQRMTIQEALRAHTMGSAYAAHQERVKGSIEPGKLADMAVWSEDPYAATPGQLFRSQIVMTIVGGNVVHQGAA